MIGGRTQREHVARFCPVYFRVVSPSVTRIEIDRLWGNGEDNGGGAFAQTCGDSRTLVRTSLKVPGDSSANALAASYVEEMYGPNAGAQPVGLLSERLHEVRYPDEFAVFTRADWAAWRQVVDDEVRSWVKDDRRWTPASVVLDDALVNGVQTIIDANNLIGAFQLREGRLDIGIERLSPTVALIEFDHLGLCRSSDLDQIQVDETTVY